MKPIAMGAAALAGCIQGGTFEGRLTNGITGSALGGMRVVASADPVADDYLCQVREVTSEPDGTFALEETCKDTTYELSVADEGLIVGMPWSIRGGEDTPARVDVLAYRAPKENGAWVLANDALEQARTNANAAFETLSGSTERVYYPEKLPMEVPTIPEGGYLVVAGKDNITHWDLVPLVPNEGRRGFAGGIAIIDHAFLGARFTSETAVDRQVAVPDPAHVIHVTTGDRAIDYIGHDALPAGRYVLMGDGDRRMIIVEFGGPEKLAPETPVAGAN